MLSARIINTPIFLELPLSSQALYFHLVMNADDDGVVESWVILKMTGCKIGDLKALEEVGLIRFLNTQFLSLVMNWTEHNKIRADRLNPSIYRDLIIQKYPDVELIQATARSDKKDSSGRLNRNIIGDGPLSVPRGPSGDGVSKVKLSKELISSNKLNQVDKKNTNQIITPQGDINTETIISNAAADIFKEFGIDEDQWVKYSNFSDEEIQKYAAAVRNKKSVNNPSGLFLYLLKNHRNIEDGISLKEKQKEREIALKQQIEAFCLKCQQKQQKQLNNNEDNHIYFMCNEKGQIWDFNEQTYVKCKYCEVLNGNNLI